MKEGLCGLGHKEVATKKRKRGWTVSEKNELEKSQRTDQNSLEVEGTVHYCPRTLSKPYLALIREPAVFS